MKKNKYHIIYTWVLMLCFVAGQYMVYAHTHIANTGNHRAVYHSPASQPQQTVTENCQLCDAMHHNTIAVNSMAYFAPVVVTGYFYKPIIKPGFVSIALILAAGRAPPLA